MDWIIVILISGVVCGVIGAVIGSNRGAGWCGFALGFLFGPLGVVASLALDNRPKCPQCLGRLNGRAKVCEHCNCELEWVPVPRWESDPSTVEYKPFTVEDAIAERLKQQRHKEIAHRERERLRRHWQEEEERQKEAVGVAAEKWRRRGEAVRSFFQSNSATFRTALFYFVIPCSLAVLVPWLLLRTFVFPPEHVQNSNQGESELGSESSFKSTDSSGAEAEQAEPDRSPAVRWTPNVGRVLG